MASNSQSSSVVVQIIPTGSSARVDSPTVTTIRTDDIASIVPLSISSGSLVELPTTSGSKATDVSSKPDSAVTIVSTALRTDATATGTAKSSASPTVSVIAAGGGSGSTGTGSGTAAAAASSSAHSNAAAALSLGASDLAGSQLLGLPLITLLVTMLLFMRNLAPRS